MRQTSTRLEPLSPERARQLSAMVRQVQNDPSKALALDDRGHVTGIADVQDNRAEHLLADLDVHA